jgi:hypothetical protein
VLIDIVWSWDRLACERSKDPAMRRGIWRILDALYDDLVMFRTPGFRAKVKTALDALKQTEDVLAVRKELEL